MLLHCILYSVLATGTELTPFYFFAIIVMQFKVGDDLGRFLVINSTDLGQHVSLMCFCHKFVACVFIHQYIYIFYSLFFIFLIVMFLMTIL